MRRIKYQNNSQKTESIGLCHLTEKNASGDKKRIKPIDGLSQKPEKLEEAERAVYCLFPVCYFCLAD